MKPVSDSSQGILPLTSCDGISHGSLLSEGSGFKVLPIRILPYGMLSSSPVKPLCKSFVNQPRGISSVMVLHIYIMASSFVFSWDSSHPIYHLSVSH
ncbi:hypothetical protein LEMLEM_LOCUS24027 [Lemmus lemmus]